MIQTFHDLRLHAAQFLGIHRRPALHVRHLEEIRTWKLIVGEAHVARIRGGHGAGTRGRASAGSCEHVRESGLPVGWRGRVRIDDLRLRPVDKILREAARGGIIFVVDRRPACHVSRELNAAAAEMFLEPALLALEPLPLLLNPLGCVDCIDRRLPPGLLAFPNPCDGPPHDGNRVQPEQQHHAGEVNNPERHR